ncbi:MAG TPA: hypothetical protein PKC98_18520 [Candidatus Melainabacteria bacterium]|nr:hypothetical protein [Candidatus Melainabacteria bacterium]
MMRHLPAIFFVLIISAPAGFTKPSTNTWCIRQNHQIFGPQNVYLTDKWMMTENLREGTTYIKELGQKETKIFNRKKMVFYIGTTDSVMKRMAFVSNLTDRSLTNLKKGDIHKWKLRKKGTLYSLPVEIYSLDYAGKRWQYCITRALGIDKKIYRDYLDWSNLPDLGGMPLKLSAFSASTKSKPVPLLDTTAVNRTSVDSSRLVIPKGARRVNEIFQVSSGRTEQLMESFSEVLGE